MTDLMSPRSLKYMVVKGTIIGLVLAVTLQAFAKQPDPVPYRGAPLIPWANKVGEHRFRSPRSYTDTLKYYDEIFRGNRNVKREKIINISTVRAVHYKNKRPRARWEGLNVYEYKGAAWIFVVFSDRELKQIAKERQRVNKPGRRAKKRR